MHVIAISHGIVVRIRDGYGYIRASSAVADEPRRIQSDRKVRGWASDRKRDRLALDTGHWVELKGTLGAFVTEAAVQSGRQRDGPGGDGDAAGLIRATDDVCGADSKTAEVERGRQIGRDDAFAPVIRLPVDKGARYRGAVAV